MASCGCNFIAASVNQNRPGSCFSSPNFFTESICLSRRSNLSSLSFGVNRNYSGAQFKKSSPNHLVVISATKPEPLKVMIAGAPASGKGTQCELIIKKYNLVHIATGDLLRAEVAAGTENGKLAKEYMEKGQLVPNEIVVMMVKDRLSRVDAQENGWLLDGFPRSESQAVALKNFGFDPDIFILLEVPEDILVERVVGRRLDPVTGKIYHLKYSPPETEEIAARLTQRFDDTEEKVKLRLQTHNSNVKAVVSLYQDIMVELDGSLPKLEVFSKIDNALSALRETKYLALAESTGISAQGQN